MVAIGGPTGDAYRDPTGSYMRRELHAAKYAKVSYIPSAYSYQEGSDTRTYSRRIEIPQVVNYMRRYRNDPKFSDR